MTALAAALLTAGFMLAASGTAGFCLVATSAPTAADLTHARRTATAGRWAVTSGALLLFTTPAHIGGITGLAFTLAIVAAALSILTKTRVRIPAAA